MKFTTLIQKLLPAAALLMAAAGPCAAAGPHPFRIDLLGTPATPQAAGRTIVIRPETRYINVVRNEIVLFDIGGKLFAWTFNGPLDVRSLVLNRVTPPGMLDHEVVAYISPDPLTDTPSM